MEMMLTNYNCSYSVTVDVISYSEKRIVINVLLMEEILYFFGKENTNFILFDSILSDILILRLADKIMSIIEFRFSIIDLYGDKFVKLIYLN